jgi:hypothetical protein
LFCDLAHGFIRSPTEKLQKLFQTPLIKTSWWTKAGLPAWPLANRLDICEKWLGLRLTRNFLVEPI